MTLDELRKEGFFQQLSEGQQNFVIARCSGKSSKEAAKTAWACTTDDSATSMARKAMKNANVTWLINKFLGVSAARRVPTAEELAAWNWEKAQSCDDPAVAIKFAQNVAKILGYEQKAADPIGKPAPEDGDEAFDL